LQDPFQKSKNSTFLIILISEVEYTLFLLILII